MIKQIYWEKTEVFRGDAEVREARKVCQEVWAEVGWWVRDEVCGEVCEELIHD